MNFKVATKSMKIKYPSNSKLSAYNKKIHLTFFTFSADNLYDFFSIKFQNK